MKTIHSKEYWILIEFLKECRINSSLTQQELAGLLGTDQTYVSKYESSQRRLDILEIREICQMLSLDFVEFIKNYESRIKGISNNAK